ncbi:hypothetical protein, partial [Parabacteroides sp.]|uniref:hypothetical protein n=1 Tax=Parabacteroides sp. TaxID=1869337 RepID=UPI0026DEDA7C
TKQPTIKKHFFFLFSGGGLGVVFPPNPGPACLRSAHGKKAILRIRHAKSGMVRDTDTYYEYKTPIYKFIAYENNFTRN